MPTRVSQVRKFDTSCFFLYHLMKWHCFTGNIVSGNKDFISSYSLRQSELNVELTHVIHYVEN